MNQPGPRHGQGLSSHKGSIGHGPVEPKTIGKASYPMFEIRFLETGLQPIP